MYDGILSKRLKGLREQRGYLQKYVADKLGIRSNTLSGYENGTRSPDPDMIRSLADLYNVTTDYLLGKSNHPELTAIEEKEVDEEVEELWEIIDSLPDEEREETIKQVLAYAKFLANANKTRD